MKIELNQNNNEDELEKFKVILNSEEKRYKK